MNKQKSIEEIELKWRGIDRPVDGTKYMHYKGGKYKIVATGFIEDTEEPCVVYQSLENGTVWVRTAKNFFENIKYNGLTQKRFKKL